MAAARLVLAVDLGTSGCKCALATLEGEVLDWAYWPVALLCRRRRRRAGAGGLVAGAGRRRRRVVRPRSRGARRDRRRLLLDPGRGDRLRRPRRQGDRPRADLARHARRAAIAARAGGRIRIAGYGPIALIALAATDRRRAGAVGQGLGRPHRLSQGARAASAMARAYKLLNVLDYLNLRLTGRFVATRNSILTAWVTDNRHGETRYDRRLIAQLGVDADKLPEIVASTDVLGPLTADAAAALGLRRDVVVVAGAIDNSAVAVGAGAVGDYDTHLYLGTSSWLGAHVPFKKTDLSEQDRRRAGRHQRPLSRHRAAIGGRGQSVVLPRPHSLSPRRAARRRTAARRLSGARPHRRQRAGRRARPGLYAVAVRRAHAGRRSEPARRADQPVARAFARRHRARLPRRRGAQLALDARTVRAFSRSRRPAGDRGRRLRPIRSVVPDPRRRHRPGDPPAGGADPGQRDGRRVHRRGRRRRAEFRRRAEADALATGLRTAAARRGDLRRPLRDLQGGPQAPGAALSPAQSFRARPRR